MLTGCVSEKTYHEAEQTNPFLLPPGSPLNSKIGYILNFPKGSTSIPILMTQGIVVRNGLFLISRDRFLNISGELEITSIHGRIAVARIISGHPQPKDEAVIINIKK